MRISINVKTLLAVLLVGGFLLLIWVESRNRSTPQTTTSTQSVTATVNGPNANNQQVREIEMTAMQWQFNPSVIRVKQGERVRIRIKSTDVAHGFAIREYNINEVIRGGEEKVIEFVADKKGEFIFYCSVPCGVGHANMRGKLIVE